MGRAVTCGCRGERGIFQRYMLQRRWKVPSCHNPETWYSQINKYLKKKKIIRSSHPGSQKTLSPLKNSYDNLDSVLKSRGITLSTKVYLAKAMVFPVAIHGCECCNIKKTEHQRTIAFELWCWKKLLKVPWTARRSNQPVPKGNQF